MAKTPDSLEVKLKNIKPGDRDTLLQARRVCLATGEPFENYVKFIPPAALSEMDERQRYVLSDDFDHEQLGFDETAEGLSEQLENAKFLLEPDFRLVFHHNQLMCVRVTNEAKKLAESMFEADTKEVLTRSLCQRVLDMTGEPMAPRAARFLVDLWAHHADTIPMPQAMARPDEDVWSFHKPNFHPDPSAKLDQWRKVLSRMSDPKAFAAWVWGVYSGKYKGRKILWLHGPSGEDGKSVVASLIAKELFGPAHHAISNAAVKTERRFLTSFFETAALVIYPDASNRRVLMSEVFKTIASAGSDPVLIERKGKQAYTATLSARLWINSNYTPEVPDSKFATSRLLYIQISGLKDEKPDPTAIDRLREELPGFLSYAERAYNELCKDDYEIRINEDTERLVADITGAFYEEFENVFNKHWLVAESTERVVASEVQERCKAEGIKGQEYSNFKRWLEELGVTLKKLSSENGKQFYFGMRKRTAADSNIVRPDFSGGGNG